MKTVRVMLPAHLRKLSCVEGEVRVDVAEPVTQRTVIDALEAQWPVLRGLIRDCTTKKRRPLVRFFACERDLSHDAIDVLLPDVVAAGQEPFLVIAAIAGG